MVRAKRVVSVPEPAAEVTSADDAVTSTNGTQKNGVAKKVSKTAAAKLKTKEMDSEATDTTEASSSRKRGRQSKAEVPVKKIKLDFRHNRGFGHVLTLGQGDTGQLGLGEDIMERNKPALVASIKDAVDVVAGGMHTAVLTNTGEVYTFGCNDEGSLGRVVEEEEECFTPGKVSLDGKIVQLSAGDSHTAALTEDGRVYAWGTFRDSSGPIGLTKEGIQKTPLRILDGIPIKKISSGSDHIAALTVSGHIYTLGNAEQGQLGRIPERFSHRGGRRGLDYLLTPDKLHAKARSTVFKDVWAGSYNTIARTTEDEVLVMGLNNYNQMGLDTGLLFFMPTRSVTLAEVDSLVLGQHHTLFISNKEGAVHAIGRSEYGRLGLGEGAEDAKVPVAVSELKGLKCVDVACGTAVSFAVTDKGHCYSWGMGTNGQLGHGEDDVLTPNLIKSKQLENRSVIAVSSGGQHTVILAKDN